MIIFHVILTIDKPLTMTNSIPIELFSHYIFQYIDAPMKDVCHYVCHSWHNELNDADRITHGSDDNN